MSDQKQDAGAQRCRLCHGTGAAIAVDGVTIKDGQVVNQVNPRQAACIICGGTGYATPDANERAATPLQDAGAQCSCRKAVTHIQEAMDIIDSARFNRFIYENLYLARKILSTPCPLEAERNMWQDAHDYMNRKAAEAIVECDRLKVNYNYCSDQSIRAHALITEIMDRVDAAYPGERQGDWDVLDQGVGRLVVERDRLEAEAQEAKYVEQKALEHAARLEEERDRLREELLELRKDRERLAAAKNAEVIHRAE